VIFNTPERRARLWGANRGVFPLWATLQILESLYAERAIRAGASGYISKQEPLAKILEAVRKVLAGEIYRSEQVATRVATKQVRAGGTMRVALAATA